MGKTAEVSLTCIRWSRDCMDEFFSAKRCEARYTVRRPYVQIRDVDKEIPARRQAGI